mgnify:CR=1 FL=1
MQIPVGLKWNRLEWQAGLGRLRSLALVVLVSLWVWGGGLGGNGAIAHASPVDLAKQPEIQVSVSLGNAANDLKFFPADTEFVAGKRYKLVLTNPSTMKHYFTAKDFADNIWSQKVEAGRVEVKGAIHELELKPGAIAEWVFVPIKAGTYELHCSIPGHTEAGMIGHLTVTNLAKSV